MLEAVWRSSFPMCSAMNFVAAFGKPRFAVSWQMPHIRVSAARMPISVWEISLAISAKAAIKVIVEAMFWMKR